VSRRSSAATSSCTSCRTQPGREASAPADPLVSRSSRAAGASPSFALRVSASDDARLDGAVERLHRWRAAADSQGLAWQHLASSADLVEALVRSGRGMRRLLPWPGFPRHSCRTRGRFSNALASRETSKPRSEPADNDIATRPPFRETSKPWSDGASTAPEALVAFPPKRDSDALRARAGGCAPDQRNGL
jgi:hypothetical protein